MKIRHAFAGCVLALPVTPAPAQTTWDMLTPYGDAEHHRFCR